MNSPLQRLTDKYPFLEITDITNYKRGFFYDEDDKDFDDICKEFLDYGETGEAEDKITVCNEFFRNLLYLSIPGENHTYYTCSHFTRWFYDQIESLNIDYEFARGLYREIGNNSFGYFPYIYKCDINEYDIIKKGPDNILKFYNFSSNFKEIKNYMKLGKSYTHSKAICDYLNECVEVYKKYVGRYKKVNCDNVLCEEIKQFELSYNDLITDLSISEYNIPPLLTSATRDVGKVSLKQDIQMYKPARLGGEHQDRSIRNDNPTLESQLLPPFSPPVRQEHLSPFPPPLAQQQLSPDSRPFTLQPASSDSDPVTPQPTSPLTKTFTPIGSYFRRRNRIKSGRSEKLHQMDDLLPNNLEEFHADDDMEKYYISYGSS
ncbi:VIR protein [Plasmodium vivax]|uniref:VIR protein n=1 Tax=Plasmodium vivax TaxID=5855 RepID=A0A1G4H768_PLAVI|nr:VIR protein [Plasmodium vivax]